MIGHAGFMQAPLAERGLRPIAELAAGRPHGDRLRYLAGCRCAECRRANCTYAKARARACKAGDWNGIIPAAKARAHLAALAAQGVGRRAVGAACDVADTTLSAIISGDKTRIRARTERAILAVTVAAVADRALIPAGPTWKLLDELIASGYSKSALARELGYKTRALQLNRHQVTARNAADVERLHRRLRMVDAAPSLRRLNELANEGYTRRRIAEQLATEATRIGGTAPDIAARCGRILATTAHLIERAHAVLME